MTLTAVLVGIAIGFAGFTFVYAKGGSYLFNGAPALILQWPIRFLDDSNLPPNQLARKTVFGHTDGEHSGGHRL
jgi:hypothetical protein